MEKALPVSLQEQVHHPSPFVEPVGTPVKDRGGSNQILEELKSKPSVQAAQDKGDPLQSLAFDTGRSEAQDCRSKSESLRAVNILSRHRVQAANSSHQTQASVDLSNRRRKLYTPISEAGYRSTDRNKQYAGSKTRESIHSRSTNSTRKTEQNAKSEKVSSGFYNGHRAETSLCKPKVGRVRSVQNSFGSHMVKVDREGDVIVTLSAKAGTAIIILT